MTIPNIPDFPSIEELNRKLLMHKAAQRKTGFIGAAAHVYANNLDKRTARKPVLKLIGLIERFMFAGLYNQALGKNGITSVKSGRKYIEKAIANIPTPERSAAEHALLMKSFLHVSNNSSFRFNQVSHLLYSAAPGTDFLLTHSFFNNLTAVFRFNMHTVHDVERNQFWDIADMMLQDDIKGERPTHE